jgi:hypothetical protein
MISWSRSWSEIWVIEGKRVESVESWNIVFFNQGRIQPVSSYSVLQQLSNTLGHSPGNRVCGHGNTESDLLNPALPLVFQSYRRLLPNLCRIIMFESFTWGREHALETKRLLNIVHTCWCQPRFGYSRHQMGLICMAFMRTYLLKYSFCTAWAAPLLAQLRTVGPSLLAVK